MSELNSQHNVSVWMDIPVVNLERASAFYQTVLDKPVHQEQFDDFKFAVLDHEQGNGGCLIPNAENVSAKGTLIYFNVNGRIKDAERQVTESGGEVLQGIHAIGPHGFRAIVLDSEGNRIALHSETDS